MKQTLLIVFTFFSLTIAHGQLAWSSSDASQQTTFSKADLKIYPNPAIDYIAFNNVEGVVKKVVIYNLVGRPIKRFDAIEGKNHYDVTDLSKGMYLIQLLDPKGNVITTKRINKR